VLPELPACFLYARDFSSISAFTEANTANSIFTKITMRSTANLATVIFSCRIFLFSLLFENHCFLSHLKPPNYLANGAPINVSNSFASSSFVAVVTNAMSIPRIFSTLSYSISGNMSCSRRPSE